MRKNRDLDLFINEMNDECHSFEFNMIVVNAIICMDKSQRRKRRSKIAAASCKNHKDKSSFTCSTYTPTRSDKGL